MFPERQLRIGRHYKQCVCSGVRAIRAAHPLISHLRPLELPDFSGKLCTTLLCQCHQTLSLPRKGLASNTTHCEVKLKSHGQSDALLNDQSTLKDIKKQLYI